MIGHARRGAGLVTLVTALVAATLAGTGAAQGATPAVSSRPVAGSVAATPAGGGSVGRTTAGDPLPPGPQVDLSAQEGAPPQFVPPTAPPATDIRATRAIRPLAASSPEQVYPCQGYGGLGADNTVAGIMRDQFTWKPWAPVTVGNGKGDVTWTLDPYHRPSWYMWLHSLMWLGPAISAGRAGDAAALAHAAAIAHDWVHDHPYPWTADVGAYEATAHRANVLVCLRHAMVATSPDGRLPAADAWVDDALAAHARFLTEHWSGAWNHGTDESIIMLGIGCILDRPQLRTLATQRLAAGITTSIDPQGATNEQSLAYALYNYSLWGRAEQVMSACGIDPGATIGARRRLLAAFLAQGTAATGKLAQLGDSELISLPALTGTDAEWAGSGGTHGTPPARRVAVYAAQGYAFGRSGWGTGATPFAQESFYSLRFGPGRQLHGHLDHMSLTYVARGRDILVDAGHAGYQVDAWRGYVESPFGHNVLTVPTAVALPSAATRLTRSLVSDKARFEYYELADAPAAGVSRIRDVIVLHDPELIVVLDRAASRKPQAFQALWHLPEDQVARPYGRSTVVSRKPGEGTETVLFQVPFRQALPRGATQVLRGQVRPRVQGWHYPDINTRKAAPVAVFARSGTAASILSVIVPLRASGPGVHYALSAQPRGWTLLSLTVGGVPVRVRISPTGALVRG